MKKTKILTFNNISIKGLELFDKQSYEVASEFANPDAIIVRSAKLHNYPINDKLKAIGRSGAGVNNIPVNQLSEKGIPVFNAPGANANAVKELVIAGLLMSSRNICQAWEYTKNLQQTGSELDKAVESGKKQFSGNELPGKVVGVIGLGAIGVKVANACIDLGMKVIGFDPSISINNALRLNPAVKPVTTIERVLQQADFITFHVPLIEATKNLLNEQRLPLLKPGVTILNLARQGIIDEQIIEHALNERLIRYYITDFPSEKLKSHEQVIALPHLGASTEEAEDNCAQMVIQQVIDFLENGNITNAVNFNNIHLDRRPEAETRIILTHKNVPGMVSTVTSLLAKNNLNIIDMVNTSNDSIASTIIDLSSPVQNELKQQLLACEGILMARKR